MTTIRTVNPLAISGEEAYRALLNAAFTVVSESGKSVITYKYICENVMKNVEAKPPLFIAFGKHPQLTLKDTWLYSEPTSNYYDLFSRAAVNYFISCESTFILDSGPKDNNVDAATLLDFKNVFEAMGKYGTIIFGKDKEFKENLNKLPLVDQYIIAFEYLLHQVKVIEWGKIKNVES